MADARPETIEALAAAILEAVEPDEDELNLLIAHTTGDLQTAFENELYEREEKALERDFEDFPDMWAPDPVTGDLTRRDPDPRD